MKLQILSNGTVSLNGTRITKRKMYGISTVLEEFDVDKKAIENIVNKEYGSGLGDQITNNEFFNFDKVIEIEKSKSYQQGAREFAEWLEKHAIVTIQDGVTMFCEDEDKRPHGYSELLAEWQKENQ